MKKEEIRKNLDYGFMGNEEGYSKKDLYDEMLSIQCAILQLESVSSQYADPEKYRDSYEMVCASWNIIMSFAEKSFPYFSDRINSKLLNMSKEFEKPKAWL